MAATGELTLRPVRPADRDRIVELTSDIWDGHDYIPGVFDTWITDVSASFQAAEIEGTLIGLQRLRPYAPGLVWYEGLRVASSYRRQGIARAMLMSAIEEAREQGFREIRLATRDAPAIRLFESAGFRRIVAVRRWKALRVEGGEPARIPPPEEARKLWPAVASSPGFELYGGVSPDPNGARDLGPDELERLAAAGFLRAGPGRTVAGLRRPWGQSIAVVFLAGAGAGMQELLMALRFEADADGANHVSVNIPPGHPSEEDLRATGYDSADAEASAFIYALSL